VTAVPLRRNRDFVLLQAGQLLSSAGTQSTSVAYPLLVLAETHSAAKTGFVAFARIVPAALLALPAGLAADRWNRRSLMIGADCVRVVALGVLVAAIVSDGLAFWVIPAVAFVEGAAAVLFSVAHSGAVRAVVPPEQLPAAAGTQTGRLAAVQLAGPPLGGALFGVARALPFAVDAASYAFSTVSLLAMRTPFQEERAAEREPLRARLGEGFHFLWSHPFLRTCALLFGLANFIGPGLLLAIVVIGTGEGLSGGAVGLLVAAFGGCLLLGSLLSPLARRRLPVRAVLLLELWTWPGCAAFLVWPSVYVLVAAMLPTALAVPSTDSVVHGYRIAMTPDRLLGRAESVRMTISLAIAPLGPLAAGALLGAASAQATIAVFAVFALALALWGTLSPSIRAAPDLGELAGLVVVDDRRAGEEVREAAPLAVEEDRHEAEEEHRDRHG
jgi:predicted MFS family arabinose efflux permease